MQIVESGKSTAAKNMATDAELLFSLNDASTPILHFYEWQNPSATYGHFSDPSSQLNEAGALKHHLELAKRPTGGGIIFHQFDFAFSFLMPVKHPCFSLNTLENYGYVNQIIAKAILRFLARELPLSLLECENCLPVEEQEKAFRNFCMAKPTVYDIVCEGRKLVGGAQRRTKKGYLHQASIALILPPDDFLTDVLSNSQIVEAMKKSSFPLLKQTQCLKDLENTKSELKNYLKQAFSLDSLG